MAAVGEETNILHLPDESLVGILRYFSYKDLVRVSTVCQRLKTLTSDDFLWKWQCCYYYLTDRCMEPSWKETFIKMHKEFGKYIEHYRDIRGAWTKIDTFLQSHCPVLFNTLQAGATEESINEAEMEQFGAENVIPLDLRLSYRIHDGQLMRGETPGLIGGGMISSHYRSDILLPFDSFYSKMLANRWHAKQSVFLSFCPQTKSGHCMPVSDNCSSWLKKGFIYISGRDLISEDTDIVQFYCIASSYKDWFCKHADSLEKGLYHILHKQYIFRFYHNPECTATTAAVTVKPTTIFMPELSGLDNYFFAYRIVMSMDRDAPAHLSCQLESRHWVITDGKGKEEEVDGPGVVGEYPIMKPGAEFAWISCCTFHNPSGSMRGFFRMRNLETGALTEVECPCYHMEAPPVYSLIPSDYQISDSSDSSSESSFDDFF